MSNTSSLTHNRKASCVQHPDRHGILLVHLCNDPQYPSRTYSEFEGLEKLFWVHQKGNSKRSFVIPTNIALYHISILLDLYIDPSAER
jgi:hypothetical protein